jgi:hypothetical protein
MTRVQLAVSVLAILSCGYQGSPPKPERTVAALTARLTAGMTRKQADSQLGAPDSATGGGLLLLYHYAADSGRDLVLAFPGDGPLVYARIRDRDGNLREIPVR